MFRARLLVSVRSHTPSTQQSTLSGTPTSASFRRSTVRLNLPLNDAFLADVSSVLEIGEVWANTLHTVYADLVTELGFSANAQKDATGKEGNVVFMQLLVNGLTIQPCNPTVLNARDAIIQADVALNNGANECTLRKAFAKKGLGLNATPDFQDDDTVPAKCQ